MAGSTPIYGLPYPTGTDRVADGDNAMQALAERWETVFKRASLTTITGWQSTVTPQAPENNRFITFGGIGVIVCRVTVAAGIAQGWHILDIPPAYRSGVPNQMITGGRSSTGWGPCTWTLTTSQLIFSGPGPNLIVGEEVQMSGTYPLLTPVTPTALPAPDGPNRAEPKNGRNPR